jgi:hypothetical protein
MFTAVLIAEPANPYDANAIAIHSPAGKVGHLSREGAAAYQALFAELRHRDYDGARAGRT